MSKIEVNKLDRLPHDRYVAALERQRERIAGGLRLTMVDSDAVGDKYTHASWGLCSEDKEAWPDAEDHIWPRQFVERGRVAPLHRDREQPCPFDDRSRPEQGGCFWRCRLFRPKKRAQRPTQQDALRLYEEAIEKAKAKRR